MSAPASLPDLLAWLQASGLVGEEPLRAATRAVPPHQPEALLAHLVAEGLLTPFQADRLRRGKPQALRIGSYQLLGKLGRGGAGHVYLARHETLRRQVAIKVLDGKFIHDSDAKTRFLREATAAAAIDSPHAVRVLDANIRVRQPYLVMEYVAGQSLKRLVARSGRLGGGLAAAIIQQAARGLQAAHDADFVHRDVKPANILIDRTDHVKISDLGLVKFALGPSNLTVETDRRLILGTADYLAPEQALDSSAVDARADLYALGGTLYFLLAGQSPFPEGGPREKLNAKLTSDPRDLQAIRPDLDPKLCDVVRTLLARSPAHRYSTAREVATVLRRFARPDLVYLNRAFQNSPVTIPSSSDALGLCESSSAGPVATPPPTGRLTPVPVVVPPATIRPLTLFAAGLAVGMLFAVGGLRMAYLALTIRNERYGQLRVPCGWPVPLLSEDSTRCPPQ